MIFVYIMLQSMTSSYNYKRVADWQEGGGVIELNIKR